MLSASMSSQGGIAMKKNRATLIILALAVCVLFAGCDMIFGFIFGLPGDWSVDYTWSGHSPGYMTISFYRNGTFDTDEG